VYQDLHEFHYFPPILRQRCGRLALPSEQVIALIVIDWQPLNRSQAQSKGGEGDQVGRE
jgi:hypothetical protein